MNPRYEAILRRACPAIPGHPPLSPMQRAAQFSPFAALTGFEDAIDETARLTQEKIPLGEEDQQAINETLRFLQGCKRPAIRVVYFQPDSQKAGGAYVTAEGRLKRIAQDERCLCLDNGLRIAFSDLAAIEMQETDP